MSQKKIKRERREKKIPDSLKGPAAVRDGEEEAFGIRRILKENWKFLLAMCVGVVLLYINGMNGDFVSDDYATIPQNPLVGDIKYSLLNKDTRNLVILSNAFIAALFGIINTFPFHFYSLLVYIVVCGVVFVFIYQLMGKNVAMMATAIFAVHPIHVEAITWISGKPYLLSTLFLLLTLINLKALLSTGKKKYLLMVVLMFFLAYKAEGARCLTIFFLAPLLFIYQGVRGVKISLKRLVLSAVVVALTVVVIIWPRIITRVNVVNSGYNATAGLFYNNTQHLWLNIYSYC